MCRCEVMKVLGVAGVIVCLSAVMKDFGGCLCVSALDGPSESFRGCGELLCASVRW